MYIGPYKIFAIVKSLILSPTEYAYRYFSRQVKCFTYHKKILVVSELINSQPLLNSTPMGLVCCKSVDISLISIEAFYSLKFTLTTEIPG